MFDKSTELTLAQAQHALQLNYESVVTKAAGAANFTQALKFIDTQVFEKLRSAYAAQLLALTNLYE